LHKSLYYSVMGIDHDQDLVQVAKKLHLNINNQTATKEDVNLYLRGEGELLDSITITLPEYKVRNIFFLFKFTYSTVQD